MSANCCGHDHNHIDPNRGNAGYRRVLWAVLAINAIMFLVEIGAGVAAGSASLQADALDFFGDAANYAISLLVIGMALRYRAYAALGKGVSMAVFGLWVIGTVVWHAAHGTLPSAITMGAVGVAAFAANAASFALLWAYREGDANMRSAWICTRNDSIGNLAVLARRGRRVRHRHRMAGHRRGHDHGGSGVAGRLDGDPAGARRIATADGRSRGIGVRTRPACISDVKSIYCARGGSVRKVVGIRPS